MMNVTSRSRFSPSWFVVTMGLLLLLLGLSPCTAQEEEEEDAVAAEEPDKNGGNRNNGIANNQKKRKAALLLAESMDTPTPPSSSMGRPAVLYNTLWAFDAAQYAPTTIIGTARGTCWQVEDDGDDAWDCQWTLTLNGGDTNGTSKIMLQGDYYSTNDDDEEETTFAIVGGTGEYNGAIGSVHVSQTEEMFRIYTVDLA